MKLQLHILPVLVGCLVAQVARHRVLASTQHAAEVKHHQHNNAGTVVEIGHMQVVNATVQRSDNNAERVVEIIISPDYAVAPSTPC